MSAQDNRPPTLRISIDGFKELVAAVGDEEALEILRKQLRLAAEAVERDLRTGGRFWFELDEQTGHEVIHFRSDPTGER